MTAFQKVSRGLLVVLAGSTLLFVLVRVTRGSHTREDDAREYVRALFEGDAEKVTDHLAEEELRRTGMTRTTMKSFLTTLVLPRYSKFKVSKLAITPNSTRGQFLGEVSVADQNGKNHSVRFILNATDTGVGEYLYDLLLRLWKLEWETLHPEDIDKSDLLTVRKSYLAGVNKDHEAFSNSGLRGICMPNPPYGVRPWSMIMANLNKHLHMK